MKRTTWHMTFMAVSLVVAAGLLTGCPKKPAQVGGAADTQADAGTAAGTEGGAGGAMGTTPGTVGAGPGPTAGSGPSGADGSGAGAAGSAGATAGGVPATGTTIPALPSPKEFAETGALRDIRFDFDKYDIRPQDAMVLEDNARWLQTNAGAVVLLEGHADERGTNEYNLALGERRAKATRDFLVALGVQSGRITVISYGEERPLCIDRSEGCWSENRRTHFLVKQ